LHELNIVATAYLGQCRSAFYYLAPFIEGGAIGARNHHLSKLGTQTDCTVERNQWLNQGQICGAKGILFLDTKELLYSLFN